MTELAISIPESLRDGRYVLGELLGQGGMAVVVVAHDTALGVDRAVKVLAPHGAHRKSLRRRLNAEARAMARLNHPNILAIHDVGVENDLDYVVMDLATGGSLHDLLERGPIDPWIASSFMVQVLSALAASHAQGIVHRDVKPHNVLLDHTGRALLADFGIALLAGEDRRTRTGVAMGSIAYMPPEQRLDAARVGPAADIYSCGSSLYNLITRSNPVDLFLASESSQRWNTVPDSLRPILRKAVNMDPEKRYHDAGSFAHALMEAIKGAGMDLPSIHGLATSMVSPDRTESDPPTHVLSLAGTHSPTAEAIDYIDKRVPTVMPAELPEIEVEPLEPVIPTPTQGPQPTTGSTTLATPIDEEQTSRWPLMLVAVLLLVGLTATAVSWLGPAVPAETVPTAPVSAEPAPTPEPLPTPEPVPAPVLVPVPEPEPVAPAPAAPAPVAPAPAPKPVPASTVGTTAVAGNWTGAFDGIGVQVALGGSDERVTGTFATVFDLNSQQSKVAGTYSPETATLVLVDQSDEPVPTRYTLTLKGDRMTGQLRSARGKRVLILNRGQ